MAVVYYPISSSMYVRNTISASYQQLVLSVLPNTVLYFDTGSGINAISASVIYLTASYALKTIGSQRSIVFCAGYTPTATGADIAEFSIPYSWDGATALSWSVNKMILRAQISGSTTSSLFLEKYTGTGSFSNSTVLEYLNLNSQSCETSTSSLVPLVSGDKVRFNTTALGTAQYWTVTMEIGTYL